MICPEKPKCFNTSHKNVDASVFCPLCNKFFCPSCDKALHKTLFTDHQSVPISNLTPGSKIITGRCGIINHENNILKYYCKDHNVPCCIACLCPKEDVGKHSKCNTVSLKDMEQHMKSTLGNVIKKLEDIIKSVENALKKIQSVHEKNEEAKNETVNQIKTSFTLIREAVNAREKELLGLVEELWEKEYSSENNVKIGIEYSEKAKQIVETAKKVEQHWDTNHLPEMAQHYGLALDTTEEITRLVGGVSDVSSKNLIIKFNLEKDDIDAFIDEIMKFGDVSINSEIEFSMKESLNNKYILEGPSKSIIRKVGNDGWDCTAIGNNTLPINSIIKWDVKVVSNEDGCVMVGVAPFDIDQNNTDNYCKCGWYFYCCNSTLWSGPPHKYYSKTYGQDKKLKNDDVVGVTMDTTKGELSFSVNGKDLGVAYSDIPLDKPLVPAIDLCNENESVEIIFK